MLFSHEHKGYLPKAWLNDRPTSNCPATQPASPLESRTDSWGYPYPFIGWDYVLLGYVKNNKQIFQCPSDPEGPLRGVTFDSIEGNQAADDNIPASYRMNLSNNPDAFTAIKITKLKPSTEMIVICDGAKAKTAGFARGITWRRGNRARTGSWDPRPRKTSRGTGISRRPITPSPTGMPRRWTGKRPGSRWVLTSGVRRRRTSTACRTVGGCCT